MVGHTSASAYFIAFPHFQSIVALFADPAPQPSVDSEDAAGQCANTKGEPISLGKFFLAKFWGKKNLLLDMFICSQHTSRA